MVSLGEDGLYHPASEDEIVWLVKRARREGRELRVRGAAHSVSLAIYADAPGPQENVVSRHTPPPSDEINVALDRYLGWRVKDEARRLVEVKAGTHLGHDPAEPSATLESSLLWQLAMCKHWALDETGGITHQTVGGFTATGSAGGSVKLSVNDNLWGFRLIDGRGEILNINRDDDPDAFHAMAPNLGLLGVVSKITFQCSENFAIAGTETTTTLEACPVDVLGDGDDDRPSLECFLREADYARLEWWPQRGAERILTWRARRVYPDAAFHPNPYRQFGRYPRLEQHFVSLIYTILGNLGDLGRAKRELAGDFDDLEAALGRDRQGQPGGRIRRAGARVCAHVARGAANTFVTVLTPFRSLIRCSIPTFFPLLLKWFVPLDTRARGEKHFADWAWHGLPMDNEASDVLLKTAFTELWLPISRARDAMEILHCHFSEPSDPHEAYRRTGTYAWELYAAKPTSFWLSPSYTSGDDDWKDGAFRIDPYWFAKNAGDPIEPFFREVWELLRGAGVPFRLHWAKYQPRISREEPDWLEFLCRQYPRWDDFLRLQAQHDPDNIFLTDYWRDRFGLWHLPRPNPAGS